VFDPPLGGLILGEAELLTDADARAFSPPDYAVAEVTDDIRFTGASRRGVMHRADGMGLREYGITPPREGPLKRSHADD
jgi:hypothetical protein